MSAAATKKKSPLVDDDEEIITSMKIALESRGYQVLTANDGNAGLAVVERDRPDLMITDMMMPKRSGFLVLEKLRTSDDTNKNVMKVIMVTATRVTATKNTLNNSAWTITSASRLQWNGLLRASRS